MLEQLRLGAAFGDGGTKTLADEAIEKRQIVSNKQSEIKNSQARVTKITGELRIGLNFNDSDKLWGFKFLFVTFHPYQTTSPKSLKG